VLRHVAAREGKTCAEPTESYDALMEVVSAEDMDRCATAEFLCDSSPLVVGNANE
jgi:hypothetical protein